jgi:hypothetical protein
MHKLRPCGRAVSAVADDDLAEMGVPGRGSSRDRNTTPSTLLK